MMLFIGQHLALVVDDTMTHCWHHLTDVWSFSSHAIHSKDIGIYFLKSSYILTWVLTYISEDDGQRIMDIPLLLGNIRALNKPI